MLLGCAGVARSSNFAAFVVAMGSALTGALGAVGASVTAVSRFSNGLASVITLSSTSPSSGSILPGADLFSSPFLTRCQMLHVYRIGVELTWLKYPA